MKSWVKKTKLFWAPAIVAFVIWIVLNITGIQDLFFKDASALRIAVIKFIHLIYLFLTCCLIFTIVRNQKKDQRYKDLIKIAVIYFCVLFVLLILVWPGAWAWDDLGVVYGAAYYKFTPWQHFFSGLFQIMALQTLPFAAGVIITQIFWASIIVGYIVSFLGHAIAKKYKKNFRLIAIILMIPFFFCPVLYYVLTGYRMAIYQYLEIFVFAMILIKSISKEKITVGWLLLLGLSTIVVSTWRTEGLPILFFVSLMLFVLKDKYLTKKRIALFFGIVLLSALAIGKINTLMIKSNDYKVGAIIYPLVVNIREGNNISDEEKDKLNKVMDLQCIDDHPELSEELIYHKCIRKEYSENDFAVFMRSSIVILLKNFSRTVSSIWEMFWQTSAGLYDEYGSPYARTTAYTAARIYTVGTSENIKWGAVDTRLKSPIDINLRANTINILAVTPESKAVPYFTIVWNHVIPVVLSIIVIIISIIKKNWIVSIIGLAIVCRAIIVACTAMAPYFMYYMPVYVSSYFIFIFTAMQLYYARKI